MSQHVSDKTRGSLLLLLTALLYGSSFVVVKGATDTFAPNYLIGIRFTIGCVFLMAIYHRRLKNMTPALIRAGVIIGVFLFGAYSLQTIGITDTTPGRNAFLTAAYVIIVPFLAWLFLHRRPNRYNIIAAVLCLAGVGFISLDASFTMSFGDAMSLGGAFLFAGQILAIAQFALDHDPVLLCILQLAVTAVLGFLFGALTEEPPDVSLIPGALPAILYLSIVISGIATLLQNIGQKLVPGPAASILLSLESVFGALVSILVGAETLSLRVGIGFVLVFVSVLLAETKFAFLRPRKKARLR